MSDITSIETPVARDTRTAKEISEEMGRRIRNQGAWDQQRKPISEVIPEGTYQRIKEEVQKRVLVSILVQRLKNALKTLTPNSPAVSSDEKGV